jgi:hypothetical protein
MELINQQLDDHNHHITAMERKGSLMPWSVPVLPVVVDL